MIDKSLQLLRKSLTQQRQMFYVSTLGRLRNRWTVAQRKVFFCWLNLAEEKYLGGTETLERSELNHRFVNFIRDICQRAVDDLNDEERATLKEVIQGQKNLNVVDSESTRRFVHNWQLADLLPFLEQIGRNRSYESGKSACEAAQCRKCHRFGDHGGTA